ncbi:ureidoglycolate dehydrogenase [Salmonella enterica subsp. enterica]|uniref:Ureidoglycolate dehydrogenase n=1 Tax=Salmonella enterica I TaxID=59201 RepID=A0A379WET7_SALET|nr:ureidoglycolate dehydrogenase [Salmonella enterica subsp. enterica]
MKISRETLHQLIENKLYKAGLKREHAAPSPTYWFMQMPEVFTHMAPYALNIMRTNFKRRHQPGADVPH